MEESIASTQNGEEEPFLDAFDQFPADGCGDSSSDNAGVANSNHVELGKANQMAAPSRTILRRRRSMSQRSSKEIESAVNPSDPSVSVGNFPKFKERKVRFSLNMVENENGIENSSENIDSMKVQSSLGNLNELVNEETKELSVITNENREEYSDSDETVSYSRERNNELVENVSNAGGNDDSDSSILLFLVNLLIKAIGFQISLLVYFVTFPVWIIYTSYMFVIDPFRIMRRGRTYVVRKLIGVWGFVSGSVSPGIYEWLKEHSSVLKLGLKCGWGILWAGYVCFVLVGLFLVAFVMGGLVIKGVVEEPIRFKEVLNFDYTEKSPAAYVPLLVCPVGNCGMEYKENVELGKSVGGRVIPPNHKLQITVSLKLPESDYNRNLGIFQVRVDFLAADGRALASSRRPCMLHFRSDMIRLLLTFLRVAPLVTGYASESQILNVKFRGFTEGSTSTSCLKVVIEQRAEFQPGAGIPEIYAASLTLESELPLLKRVMWYWKKTLFVWISMTLFAMELFFALLCCKPLMIPRIKLRGNSANRGAPRGNRVVQR